jgi:hypothetical protein
MVVLSEVGARHGLVFAVRIHLPGGYHPYPGAVATFPPVGDLERDAALHRIERKHLAYGDSHWSEAGSEARDVLDYLRRHRSRLPRQLVDDDAWNELVLSAWVYWDERRREAELIRHALARGLSLREVGAFVGLHTGQGLRDYLDSLDARLHEYRRLTREPRPEQTDLDGPDLLVDDHDDSPDDGAEGPSTGDAGGDPDDDGGSQPRRSRNPYLRFQGRPRARRGADGRFTRSRRAAANARPAREIWIERHHQRIHTVLTDLLEQAARLGFRPVAGDDDELPGLGDYLTWITEDSETGVDHGTFGSIGLALGELRTHPEVTALARHHRIHRAIAAADRLRADYAALTADPGTYRTDTDRGIATRSG